MESAVASPSAALAACGQIRKFLSKDNYTRPHVQYNAIMLVRILADNPGQSFTKNMDKGFTDTLKQLLRNGRDPSVNQILRETLDAFERDKAYDTNLNAVFAMWRKEKGLMASATGQQPGRSGPRTLTAPPWNSNALPPGVGGGESYGRSSKPERGLPPPLELSGRIEEARTSAKLLLQLVQSTPPTELLSNELVKEFSERCVSAQRSIQGYINCDNPPPDDDTMLTLIETNEQLSLAASKHHRAVLQARRTLGPTPSPPISTANSSNPLPAIPVSSSILTNPLPPPPPQPPRADPTPILLSNIYTDDLSRIPSYPTTAPTIPLSLQAAPQRQRTASPTTTHFADDPFADHHSGGYDAPSSPPPPPPPPAAMQRLSDREEALQRDRERDRNGGPGLGLGSYKTTTMHSPTSYSPGLAFTPSYLQRQESADRNVAMHGAVSPLRPALDDDLDRDYAIVNGGRPGGRLGGDDEAGEPHSPERVRVRPDSDVSPIAERGPVTYRY